MPLDENVIITSEQQLDEVATRCVNEFWSEIARQPPPPYTLTRTYDSVSLPQGYRGLLLLSIQNTTRHMDFKFCTNHILGQPEVIFRAALELELALLLLKQAPDRFSFNYQRRIAPLIPVTGAAVHIIRNIVWGIEKALQRHAATRFLIDRQHARRQLLFYYHQLRPSEKEKSDYFKRRSHDWVHALYLAMKSSLFLPLSLLQRCGLSPGLESFWWDCHGFFSQTDRNLLEDLAAVPSNQTGAGTALRENRYEDHIVAMFKLLPT